MPKTRPPYPPEFRRQAVKLVRSGTSIKQVAEALGGVSEQTLRNWVRQGDVDMRHLRRRGRQIAVGREPGEQHHPLHQRLVGRGQRPRHHRLSLP
jgi:transposase-like protein